MTADLAAVGVSPTTPRADIATAAAHMRAALAALGFDTSRDGVEKTPERFVRALDELTWGRHLATRGVAVLVRSDHSCMSSRGARAHGADTVTDDYRGLFAADASARVEFLIKALGASVASVEELG